MVDMQVDFEDIEGKTVRKVFGDYCDEVLIVFTDNTFCSIQGYTADEETTIENGNFHIDNWPRHAEELLSLGLVSQNQYDRHKERLQQCEKKEADARRAEYERLKAEFEKN